MKKITFTKMAGAGNDFIVIDKKINPYFNAESGLVGKLCKRRTGIGADGLITLHDEDEFDFSMNYFNSDGSSGALCGNGARCIIKYAYITERLNSSETKFLFNDEIFTGIIHNKSEIEFNLHSPNEIRRNFYIELDNRKLKVNYVNVGTPHVVIKISDIPKELDNNSSFFDDIEDVPVYELGRKVRYHKEFAPEGVNVNFIDVKNGSLLIRTYERGVEEETLSCGTGAVSSAIIVYLNEGINPPVKLLTLSKEYLTVNFDLSDNKFNKLSLTGNAQVIYNGEFLI
ncbi:diaminopimelate epimerase [bacterium BMS3Abin04]|nr:diaminopimelate epimerase [bacterium BMS3Abin04]